MNKEEKAMKKKLYDKPVMEILFFEGEDIICASDKGADNDTDSGKLFGDTQSVSDYVDPVE